MATEYISREAAIKAIMEHTGMTPIAKLVAETTICRVPAADVRPVVHRSWIVTDHGDYQLIECDQCHAQMWNHQSELPNYCYCCGADMRKVVEIDQVKEGAE